MYRPDKRTLAISLLAFGGLAISPAAQASTVVQTRSDAVSYNDLNLATRAGDKVMLKRLEHAAVKACGGFPDGPDLDVYLRFDACEAGAMKSAMRELNNAGVSQLYARETHTRAG